MIAVRTRATLQAAMPSLSPPASMAPSRRRVVPSAHIVLAARRANEAPPAASKVGPSSKGDVSTLIRAMPNASSAEVVVAARAKGIETTTGYVSWRRWDDRRKGGKATKSPVRDQNLRATAPAPPRNAAKVAAASPEKRAAKANTTDGSDVEAGFRRAALGCILEQGLERTRTILSDIEARVRTALAV